MSIYDQLGFCDFGCLGTLVVGGIPLNTPAWDLPNPFKLFADQAVRGENLTLPGVVGRRGNPHRLTESAYDLAFLINGEVNRDGTPYDDPWVGLMTNLDYLWDNVFVPVDSGRGTREATLFTVADTTRTALVQVEPLHIADIEDPRYVEAVIHLTVVSGRFV